MHILLNIKDLIEESDDLTFDNEQLEILNEDFKSGIKSTARNAAKYSHFGLKSLISGSIKGIRGVKTWIDYLNSIERYKELIDKTENRISNTTDSEREKYLKNKLDRYRFKFKKIQLKEQQKRAAFIADTEVKNEKVKDLKTSDPNNKQIPELEEEISNRKQILSKIGYHGI